MEANNIFIPLTHDNDNMFSRLNCLITVTQKQFNIKAKGKKSANSAASALHFNNE